MRVAEEEDNLLSGRRGDSQESPSNDRQSSLRDASEEFENEAAREERIPDREQKESTQRCQREPLKKTKTRILLVGSYNATPLTGSTMGEGEGGYITPAQIPDKFRICKKSPAGALESCVQPEARDTIPLFLYSRNCSVEPVIYREPK